jgi:hypothetical protein
VSTVPYQMCECGLRGFDSRHAAQKALGKAQSKRKRSMDRTGAGSRRGMVSEHRTFVCPSSGLFHLTTSNRKAYGKLRVVA